MRNLRFFTLSALFLLIGTLAFSQSIKLRDGELSALKGVKKLNIKFTYDDMKVGKMSESDYIDKKVEEYNKKEKGKGDTWKENWVNDREKRFEPSFKELFEKYAEIPLKQGEDEKFTLVVNTDFTEPGFNIGIMRSNAYVDLTCSFYEKGNDKPICVLFIKKSPGRDFGGYDFDSGERIEEAYSKAGKELGKYLDKKVKK